MTALNEQLSRLKASGLADGELLRFHAGVCPRGELKLQVLHLYIVQVAMAAMVSVFVCAANVILVFVSSSPPPVIF